MTRLESGCLQLLACSEVANIEDPIVGDLLEERQSGRSLSWFLREVFHLLLAGIWHQIKSHKVQTAQAIWMGLLPFKAALDEERVTLAGDPRLAAAFPNWLGLSPFAGTKKQAA